MITSQKKQEAKTKYVDLSELSNEYKKVIRKDVYKFTKRGEEILNNYYKLIFFLCIPFILYGLYKNSLVVYLESKDCFLLLKPIISLGLALCISTYGAIDKNTYKS